MTENPFSGMDFPIGREFRIGASGIGLYFKDNCQLHLQLNAERNTVVSTIQVADKISGAKTEIAYSKNALPSTTSELIMKRGIQWEQWIVDELTILQDDTYTVVDASSPALNAKQLFDGLRYKQGHRVIVYHLKEDTCCEYGSCFADAIIAVGDNAGMDSLAFSKFEPDFLVFENAAYDPLALPEPTSAPSQAITLYVIDAKSSSHLKLSHQMQIGYYSLALRQLISWHGMEEKIHLAGQAAVWHPPTTTLLPEASPQKRLCPLSGVSEAMFDVHLLEDVVAQFIRHELPQLLSVNLQDADWHYNPSCMGCEHEPTCEARSVSEQTLSLLPNISHADKKQLRAILADFRKKSHISSSGSDIEDLHTLFNGIKSSAAPADVNVSRSVVRRLDAVCKPYQDPRTGETQSAALLAAKSVIYGSLSVFETRQVCTAAPHKEDVAIFLDFAVNPLSGQPVAWSVHIVESSGDMINESGISFHKPLKEEVPFDATQPWQEEPEPFACASVLTKVASFLSTLDLRSTDVQLYVPTQAAHTHFVQLINDCVMLDEKLQPAYVHAANVCVKAFIESAEAIVVADPPEHAAACLPVASGSITDKTSYKDLERAAQHAGVVLADPKASKPAQVSQIKAAYQELQQHLIHAPRIAIIFDFFTTCYAFPCAGYVSPSDVAVALQSPIPEMFVSDDRMSNHVNAYLAAHEATSSAFVHADAKVTDDLLKHRAALALQSALTLRVKFWIHAFLSCRQHILSINKQLLPLPTARMNLQASTIRNPALRKLLYVRDFDCTAGLAEVRLGRITRNNCVDLRVSSVDSDLKHIVCDVLTPPLIAMEADNAKDFRLCKYITYKTMPSDSGLDAGFLFQDVQFLNQTYSKGFKNLIFSSIVKVETGPDGLMSKVTLALEKVDRSNTFCKPDDLLTLAPRFVDFTSPKLFKVLYSEDSITDEPPWLLDECRFRAFATEKPALFCDDASRDKITKMRSTFKLTKVLSVSDENESYPLTFRGSQRTVFNSMLQHRVFTVWGPPGTGKTHFLALSTLLMLAAAYNATDGKVPFRVLISASTHPAIDNLLHRIVSLLQLVPEAAGVWQKHIKVFKVDGNNAKDLLAPTASAAETADIDMGAAGCEEGETAAAKISGEISSSACAKFPFVVVGCTVWQVENHYRRRTTFDCVLIDEASQLQVSEALIPARCVAPRGRIVVCGDHKQLGPVLRHTFPVLPNHPPLHGSLLDLMIYYSARQSSAAVEFKGDSDDEVDSLALPGHALGKLRQNYRMSSDLTHFTQRIYGPEYVAPQPAGVLVVKADRWRPVGAVPYNLLQLVDGEEEGTLPSLCSLILHPDMRDEPMTDEMQATLEAQVVADLLLSIHTGVEWGDYRRKNHIFVVAPHRIQREYINRFANERFAAAGEDITPDFQFADTIERRQGTEADVVIVAYSYFDSLRIAAESNFVYTPSRINVAITRAKSCCIFVGSSAVLAEVSKSNQPSDCAAVLATVSDNPSRRDCLLHMLAFVASSVRFDVTVSPPSLSKAVDDDTTDMLSSLSLRA